MPMIFPNESILAYADD